MGNGGGWVAADLQLKTGPREGERFPVRPDAATVLGRSVVSHVILDHPDVSPIHCLLVPSQRDDAFALLDAWSDEGTRVNGRPWHKGGVRIGDVVSIGPFDLELVEAAEPDEPLAEEPSGPTRFALWRDEEEEAPAAALRPGSVLVVGRHELADVKLSDPYVSQLHLAIALCGGRPDDAALVVDLRSSNGTCVDGRRIHRGYVGAGTALTLGGVRLVLRPAKPDQDATGDRADLDLAVEHSTELIFPDEPGSRLVPPPDDQRPAGASTSYAGYFGLDDVPFRLTPDPDYLFRGGSHGPALRALRRWLRGRLPLAAVTGPPGSGKTLLVACLARELAYRRPEPVIVWPGMEEWSLGDLVAAALARATELHGALPGEGDAPLARWPAAAAELRRRNILVAILADDAETSCSRLLDALPELLSTQEARVATRTLLAGGPDLLECLAGPPLEAFVGETCRLEPLTREGVAAYIAHRLARASGRQVLPFSRHAVELIAERSEGVPRLVNIVADAALFAAYKGGRRTVDRELVAEAIRNALEPGPAADPSPPP